MSHKTVFLSYIVILGMLLSGVLVIAQASPLSHTHYAFNWIWF